MNLRTRIFRYPLAIIMGMWIFGLPGWTQSPETLPASWRDLKFPTPPPFHPPKPRVERLKNGIQVFLLEDHPLPVIRLIGFINIGSVHAPKPGVAELTGQLLRTGGTQRRTPQEIDTLLDQNAIEITITIGNTNGRIYLAALREHFQTGLQVLAEMLTEPRWDAEQLTIAQRQRIAFLLRENDNPEAIARREFQKVVFGTDTPYGRYPTVEDIRKITPKDLRAFHARYIRPDRIILGVWGDFQTRSMLQWLNETLGQWKAPRAAVERPPFRPTRPGIYLVKKKDVTQTKIRMGYVVPPFDSKNPYDRDIYALQVANAIFGQGFSSRLFNHIRSQMGLAYYAFSEYSVQFDYPGLFLIATATKAETTVQTIRALKDEIERIRREGVTEEEIHWAKEWLINSFVFQYESAADIVFNYLHLAATGLPLDYLDRYVPNIQAVTKADVERVIRHYWHPDRMAILVVGAPEKFDSPLSTLGSVQEIPLPAPTPSRRKAP